MIAAAGARGRAASGVLALLMAVVLAGCSIMPGGGDPLPANDDDLQSLVVEVPAADRKPAPDIVAPTFDGDTFDLSAMRGTVVAVNVWGSWCDPCRREAPGLVRAYEQLQGRGVEFVGLDSRDSQANAEVFLRQYGITWPNIADQDGALQARFISSGLPPQAIPSTLVIDAQGRVAARIIGETTAATLTAVIEPLLDPADAGAGSPS